MEEELTTIEVEEVTADVCLNESWNCNDYVMGDGAGNCLWTCDTVASEELTPGTCTTPGLNGCCYHCYNDCSRVCLDDD